MSIVQPMEYLVQNFSAVKFRQATLNGRDHLVVPMTMIVPGVLRGSKGALFYPPDEVGKDPTPWNGMPITDRHPVRNGKNVSAHSHPEIIESQGVGVVKSAKTDGKLRAEAWIDVEKANKVNPKIIQNIKKGLPLEISTGLFTNNHPASKGANHNGKPYEWIARDYRPDHLAVLTDERGACSIDDGCGLGVNKLSEDKSEIMSYNNRWSQKKRDELDSSDFAGPHESYPIKTQKDVDSAAKLIGHADDPESVKKRIKSIAKRKGLKVPDSWETTENSNPEGHNQWTTVSGKGANYHKAGTSRHEYRIAKGPDDQHTAVAIRRLPNGKPDISRQSVTDLGKHATLEKAKSAVEKHAKKAGFLFHEQPTGNNMAKRVTTNAMSVKDHEKAAIRLSKHADEISKTSDGYEGSISDHSMAAVQAAKDKDHGEASTRHIKASKEHLDSVDEADSEEMGTHIAAAKAHAEAAESHNQVATIKRDNEEASAADDSFGDEETDEDEALEDKLKNNSYGDYKTSGQECKMKSNAANDHSELAEKTGREVDHAKASRLHQDAAMAYMSHEDGADTDKAAKHSKKAEEHKEQAGPGFMSYNALMDSAEKVFNSDDQRGSSSNVSNSREDNMAKLSANQRTEIINSLTSNSGCGCWKPEDKEVLQGFSDDRLNELKANADEHLATNSEGSNVPKQLTEAEFMEMAPATIKEAVTNALGIVKDEKDRLVTKLVANYKDQKKVEMTEFFGKKDLTELRILQDVVANSAPPAPAKSFVYGPTGNAAIQVNGELPEDKDAEEMAPSRFDWNTIAQLPKSAARN